MAVDWDCVFRILGEVGYLEKVAIQYPSTLHLNRPYVIMLMNSWLFWRLLVELIQKKIEVGYELDPSHLSAVLQFNTGRLQTIL